MKFLLYIFLAIVFAILAYITIILFSSPFLNNYENPKSYYKKELETFKEELHQGVAGDMQQLFPEGYCFTNILYGVSAAEYVKYCADSEERNVWQSEILWSIKQLESDEALKRFDKNLKPIYGAFYQSWYTWLLGKYLTTFPYEKADSILLNNFRLCCRQITETYLVNKNPYPSSYYGSSWPGDVIIGITALELSDRYFKTNYNPFIQNWLDAIKTHLDSPTKLIPHLIHKDIIEESRGSSQGLILRFLYEIDSTFARTQYEIYKNNFEKSFLGFSLIKENQQNKNLVEDIDSGPVILGFGSVASIVGVGTAKFFNDSELYSDLNVVIESVNPLVKEFVADLPIADLFLFWSRISSPMNKNSANINSISFNYIKYCELSILVSYTLLISYLFRIMRKNKQR